MLAPPPCDMADIATRLIDCIMFNRSDAARDIIESGQVDLDARDEFEDTLLKICVFKNNIEIAELLIASGCDMDARDRSRSTALHRCVFYNRMEITELLVANGCDMNARDDDMDQTTLHQCLPRDDQVSPNLVL